MWRYHEEGREKRITRDLKSLGPCPCGFDPRRPHQRDEYPSSAYSHLSLGTQLHFVTARCGEKQAGSAQRFVLASDKFLAVQPCRRCKPPFSCGVPARFSALR